MLDCISEFEFGLKSLMALDDVTGPLPCLEDLWENTPSDEAAIPPSCKSTLLLSSQVFSELCLEA